MNKPIIDHQGVYVTPPENGVEVYEVKAFLDEDMEYGIRVESFKWHIGYGFLCIRNLYITREAAEMAVFRIECIQRLKVRQHNAWLPKRVDPNLGYEMINSITGGMGVYFPTPQQRDAAHKDMSEFEREAFSYIYKPEEEK